MANALICSSMEDKKDYRNVERRLPDFLSNEHHWPTLRVRCPIHGLIPFSKAEQTIIDHWTFQRLRRIKQLALCYYVYPGAVHTRFEHSLGVMHFSTLAFDLLLSKYANLMEDAFKQVEEIGKNKTLAKARQLVRLLGLTHDIGHTPFSHAGEILINGKHENLSSIVVTQRDLLGDLLDDNFFKGASSLLGRILDKTKQTELPPQIQIIQQIFSGQLDFDRADYLLRDAYHCGVDYGNFDHHQLIDCLALALNPDTGEHEIGITDDGVYSFEALLLARLQMNLQVYGHKIRRIYDLYIQDYLKCWAKDKIKSPNDVLNWDDDLVLGQIYSDAKTCPQNNRNDLAKRIIERRHHREIFHSRSYIDPRQKQKVKSVCKELKKEFPAVDFICDVYDDWIHKLYVPGRMEQEKIEDFFVIEGHNNKSEQIGKVSKILSTIPTKYRLARIFTSEIDRNERDKLEKRAEDLYNNRRD